MQHVKRWPELDEEASIQNINILSIVKNHIDSIYRKIISPERLFFLDISPQAASRRKNGHSNRMIAEKNGRLRSYFGCEAGAVHAWHLDATMPPEEIVKMATKGVWQLI